MKYLRHLVNKYPLSCLLIVVIWILCFCTPPHVRIGHVKAVDKWTHAVMYLGTCLVIWWEYHRNHTDSRNGKRLVTYGIVCPIIMGILIELAQAYLTTCRSGDWFDAVCNSIGVLLGSLAGYLIWRKRR